jgi:hypothetical protein
LTDNWGYRYARERRNPSGRLHSIGTKFGRAIAKRMLDHVPPDPLVEAVSRMNGGVETLLY